MFYSILLLLEYILKKNYDICSVFVLPDTITKSYPESIVDWIANAPKMAVNVRDKFELDIFRPTAAN